MKLILRFRLQFCFFGQMSVVRQNLSTSIATVQSVRVPVTGVDSRLILSRKTFSQWDWFIESFDQLASPFDGLRIEPVVRYASVVVDDLIPVRGEVIYLLSKAIFSIT